MFKFNNSHIFTGYLKQKLSSVYIPTCRIYTSEFADYFAKHGEEDPRIVESTDTYIYDKDNKKLSTCVNYLRDNEVYNYFVDRGVKGDRPTSWVKSNMLFYDSEKYIPGLTKNLKSPGLHYDAVTHEYLGEYLRFLRDYHNVNLMSLYNCFSNSLCSNLTLRFEYNNSEVEFVSKDSKYNIYSFPVKLFNNYTIAVDSNQGIEICCGLYHTHCYNPDVSGKTRKDLQLSSKTYEKVGKTFFSQPILYDKLDIKNWEYSDEFKLVDLADGNQELQPDHTKISRRDIITKEQDLRMFIKVPVSCRSSIVVLEGDYRNYNNALYIPNIDKNLKMRGCSEGSTVYITGELSDSIRDYAVSSWQYAYYQKNSDESQENSDEPQDNSDDPTIDLLVPSIEFIEDIIDDSKLWTQGTTQRPAYDVENNLCYISNGAELAYVIENNGKTIVDSGGSRKTVTSYKLTNDIYLNDPRKINWKTGDLADGVSDYEIRQWFGTSENNSGFSGFIEGDGHTIYGLYYSGNATKDSTGLIPVIDSDNQTLLRNLGINYVYLKGAYASAFVGNTTPGKTTSDKWSYSQNHSVVNFVPKKEDSFASNDTTYFRPISKLQLLEFNTGESYPFADRLVEYMSGSVVTPLDEITDNIKRAQRVMNDNGHYFQVSGLWENKMQKILYDYIMNSGPFELQNGEIIDKRNGYHGGLVGHTRKSTVYDILGYVDKDTEKWYASVKNKNDKVSLVNTIQNVDIYDGLYDV